MSRNIIIDKCIDSNAVNNGGLRVSSPRAATGIANNEAYRDTTFSSTLPTTGNVNDKYKYRLDEEAGFNFATVAVTSSDSGVVSGIPGKRIQVENYTIVSAAAANVYFASNVTALQGTFAMPANGGITYPSDAPAFRTEVGEALNLITDAGAVSGHITYRIF